MKERWAGTEEGHRPHYPLQEPLWPATHPINADSHLGKGGDVQDLHEEGVILFPLKPGRGMKKGRWSQPALAIAQALHCVAMAVANCPSIAP